MRIALLRNPASSNNLGRPVSRYPSAIDVVEPVGKSEIPVVLQKLRDESAPDLLLIDGGDGTIREIVTHLPDIFGTETPFLGIIANGNTNLIARSAGTIRNSELLEGFLKKPGRDLAGMSRKIPLLRIDSSNRNRRTERGFMAGWGAYAAGSRIAIEELGTKGGKQVAGAVLKTLRRALFGQDAKILRKGVTTRLSVSGQRTDEKNRACFIGLATTLPGRLTAGLNPFWGTGNGAIRWTHVRAPARGLLVAAPLAMFGRQTKWMAREGYSSGRSEWLELEIGEPHTTLVLDGEFIALDGMETLSISAQETLNFVALR